jgi:hypothetical protein
MVNASTVLVWSFVALALLVAGTFVAAVHVAQRADAGVSPRAARGTVIAGVVVAAWLALTFSLAAGDRLSFTSRPPTMMLLIVLTLALAVALGTSRLGFRLATRIPLAALVGAQAFRFPLELMLHRAYIEGLMPVEMSYSGFNLDILTGLFAIVVALQLVRSPRSLVVVRIWNTGGIVLLANILIIALLSAPTPFRVFHNEPANVWIAHAPWVWLPTVFVVAAIVGHILVLRRVRFESRLAEPGQRASSATRAATVV